MNKNSVVVFFKTEILFKIINVFTVIFDLLSTKQ